jgi:integrase/recombinase XerD
MPGSRWHERDGATAVLGINYIRNGGNAFYLQRILGHSTLEMTNKYVRSLGIDDVSAVDERLSMLTQKS